MVLMDAYLPLLTSSVGVVAVLLLAYLLRYVLKRLETLFNGRDGSLDYAVDKALDRRRKWADSVLAKQNRATGGRGVLPEEQSELDAAIKLHDQGFSNG